MMLEFAVIVWLIGAMFTAGFSFDPTPEDETPWKMWLSILLVLALWPLVLGGSCRDMVAYFAGEEE